MLTIICWLVKHWLPGWHLISPEAWEKQRYSLPNDASSGYHIRRAALVRNPKRRSRIDLRLIEEEMNDTKV
jgi:hypothetical protein